MDSQSSAYEIGKVIGGLFGCFLAFLIPALFLFFLIMALTRKTRVMTLWAVVTGVLSLVMILGLIVFGARKAAEVVEESGESRVFGSSDGLVELTGVPGWRELDLDAEDATLRIGNLFSGEFLIIIPELKADFENGTELLDFAEMASDQVITVVEEAKASEFVALTIQGQSAYEQEVTGTIEGSDLVYLNTYIEGEDHFYQVMAWTLRERRDSALPRLRSATASFAEKHREMP